LADIDKHAPGEVAVISPVAKGAEIRTCYCLRKCSCNPALFTGPQACRAVLYTTTRQQHTSPLPGPMPQWPPATNKLAGCVALTCRNQAAIRRHQGGLWRACLPKGGLPPQKTALGAGSSPLPRLHAVMADETVIHARHGFRPPGRSWALGHAKVPQRAPGCLGGGPLGSASLLLSNHMA